MMKSPSILRPLGAIVLLAGGFFCGPVRAQKQAAHIGFLTTPASRDGTNAASSRQYRAIKPLKIAPEMRIEGPFAWNRTDRYQPPDFEVFFPDDPEGGKQLDALFRGQLGGHHKPEDVLAAVRQGLRHTNVYTTQILSQIGNGFVWGVQDQDPRAIELLYHASDVRCKHAHQGMYYGLCVLKERTPNVVRTIMNNYTEYGGGIQGRVLWGFENYGDRAATTKLLEDQLSQPDALSDKGVVAALDLYKSFTGRAFDAPMLANRGTFVIGFTHEGVADDQDFRATLHQWSGDPTCIMNFVVRVDQEAAVGVGLIRGIGNREKIVAGIEASPAAKLVFAETFAPAVLQSRQLREFATALPDGLPELAKPNYGAIPPSESHAWNATDGYQQPDYLGYFPDDADGGKQLDQLYEHRKTTELTARQQLEIVRNGLRRSSVPGQGVISWVTTICGWPEDPMAKEILYHAADPGAPQKTRYAAIYYGLSGWWEKPPNVLRLFAEIVLTEPFDRSLGSGTVGRISWSLRAEDEKRIVAEHLDRGLQRHADFSPEKLTNLTQVYRQLTDKKPTAYDQFKDRGKFFIGYRVNRVDSTQQLIAQAVSLFGQEAYFVDAVSVKPDAGVMVIVQGMGGLELAMEKLETEEIRPDFGGPLALFKDVNPKDDAVRWLEKIEKYLDEE